MIKDFVRDNRAYVQCDKCGEEITILNYVLTEDKKNWTIDSSEQSIGRLDSFYIKHKFCAPIVTQTEIKF